MTPAHAECYLILTAVRIAQFLQFFTTLEYFICRTFWIIHATLFVSLKKKNNITSIEYFIRIFVSFSDLFPKTLFFSFLLNDISRCSSLVDGDNLWILNLHAR